MIQDDDKSREHISSMKVLLTQNEFNMQSDGALMKKHIKNISRNDVSAVHKAYGLCNGNSSCELIKLHVFKSDSCTLNLSSQIPYGIFLL